MDIINHTPYQATYSMGIRPNGKNCLVVVIKASYDFPKNAEDEAVLSQKQIEIYDTDGFVAEPGMSSPLYENDYASFKPKCDVLIHGVAQPSEGKVVKKIQVTAQVSTMKKSFYVTGKRYWEKKGLSLSPSKPEPFSKQTINWEIAYGGIDKTVHEDPDIVETFLHNPVGIGYWKETKTSIVKGSPVAQTESITQAIESPNIEYRPQGFGPIARNMQPRPQYSGTYDEKWQKTRKPFLPDDFNELYYQCAPIDQQINYLQGGESVELTNLSAKGKQRFKIPQLEIPIKIMRKNGKTETPQTVIDTLSIDTEKQQFTLVARTQVDFIHSMLEISQIQVGEKKPATQTTEEQEAENA